MRSDMTPVPGDVDIRVQVRTSSGWLTIPQGNIISAEVELQQDSMGPIRDSFGRMHGPFRGPTSVRFQVVGVADVAYFSGEPHEVEPEELEGPRRPRGILEAGQVIIDGETINDDEKQG